ncbi:MAG: hypothetical protein IKN27_06500 [Selenomonadaceae bacterium]|nr:hypothetical protein [Selenomonadaceae bacterium]
MLYRLGVFVARIDTLEGKKFCRRKISRRIFGKSIEEKVGEIREKCTVQILSGKI